MTIKEILQWVIEHKDYAPLYSAMVATGALAFSILSSIISNIISKNRAKKDKIISDSRYEEQREQYEERLKEERKQREEDKRETEEKLRVSEEPYLVFKNSKVNFDSASEKVEIQMEFLNKGRGSAYEISPDVECKANTPDMKEIQLYRCSVISDPIAMVGELFVVIWCYESKEKLMLRMMPTIKFKDASGREYKQTYCIDIIDRIGNANIINYAHPELCAKR